MPRPDCSCGEWDICITAATGMLCSEQKCNSIEAAIPQTVVVWGMCLFHANQKIMSIPARIPTMVENAGSLLWYIKMD